MSLKKCQTELLKQIMENGKDEVFFILFSEMIVCRGIVECEHLSQDIHYGFMRDVEENKKTLVEFNIIPKLCQNCTKCGEAI